MTMHRPTLAILALLLLPLGATRAEEAPVLRLDLPGTVAPIDRHYGIYVLGQKAGWAHETLERLGSGRAALYVVRLRARFEMQAMGQVARMSHGMLLVFDGRAPYRLRSARTLDEDDAGRRDVQLRIGPEGATATITESGETRTLTPEPVDYTLEDYLSPWTWIREGREVGDALRVRDYDVSDLEADTNAYEVLARKETIAHGVPVVYYEVSSSSERDGPEGTILLDAEGQVISMVLGRMFEMRLEPEEIAKKIAVGADLFKLGTAAVSGRIGDPTKVTDLVLEVHGEGASSLPDGPRQTIEREGEDGPWVIGLGRAHANRYPVTPEDLVENLRETVELPIRHPEVVALARRAAGDAETDREKVARLVAFVSEHVHDAVATQSASVLDLVRTPRGDCTEHALLFTALARALGIPARDVSGLMYMGDRASAFGGHAWNEVVLDGEWVQVDAAWDQTDVDATHITLSRTGKDQVNQFDTYGALRFVVRSVETRD